ncbi:hypothetical protein C7M84_017737 [Penaeus vannamei]|uniref:Ubiquitin-like protease family profile domain-containing protein n=1 Tax=Penaeus vannamei TaxID=6689 RepID=A0A3R7PF70_PENVA|nr:hypothetical protein C7M84_017737 [Penaeus vannamei]
MRTFFKRLSLFSQLRNVDKEIEEALEARRRLEEGTLPAEAERQLASRQQVHARLVAGNKATALVSSAPFLLGLGMLVIFVVFLVLYLLRKLFVQQGTKLKSDSGCADTEPEECSLSEQEVLEAPEPEEFSLSEQEVLDAAEPEEFSLSEQEVLEALNRGFSLSEQEGVAVPQTPVFYPRLSSADAEDVLLNRELSDDVIDGAMSLIAIHFPHMQGLMASGAHWLTLSNVFGRRPDEVVVYDSYYGHLSPSSSALLSLLFARYPDASHRVERVQRQPDSTSCGKWAIAFAFDLALGINPGGRTYSFDAMSEHLIDAFRTGQVKPFPGAWSQALSEQEVLDATEPEDFSLSEQEVLEAPERGVSFEQEVLDAAEPAIEPKGVAVPQTPVFYPRLSSADAEDVLLNRELSDDVIDGAMSLIAIHFPHMQGLMASGGVMFMEPFPEPQPPRFIQIVNRSTVMSLDDMSQYGVGAGSHWLTLSNVFGRRPDEVVVYDSYYGHLSPSSSALLSLLFARYPDASHRVERVQRQPDSTSCGKWAIAFAFDLALGINPGGRTYSFDAMSEHLIDAFRTGRSSRSRGPGGQAQ